MPGNNQHYFPDKHVPDAGKQRPPTAPTKRRGPQKNGGVVGLYDYNVGKKPYEQRTPFERQTGR